MKKNIALVAGGFTGESVISLNSTKTVYKNLDRSKYNVYQIIIDSEKWYHEDEQGESHLIDKNDFSINIKGTKVTFDCAFIIIHGIPGEDGKLQGYFDMLNIPYTSCDATTSAITMNKGYTKQIVSAVPDLNIAKSVQLFSLDSYKQAEIEQNLGLPLFVKPNNGGSSIGMSKVNEWDDLDKAVQRAFAEGSEVLIEEFISGREFTVGAYTVDGEVNVLPITEIITTKEFFDFEAKYTAGLTNEVTPAELDNELVERIGEIIKRTYIQLNCKGMVRIDFILKDNKDFYFIEVNTIPGQSENSIIPQQVRAAGLTLTYFYGNLIDEALKTAK
ncbi:D-alanine/D-alanine ligase [Pseudopedobacter saltans DSM 12145]|uniref:D-alanine--D-alanine ligase n=1 Tax=Pseudopedobacter saltans (strain ATCC 51119 / DSM 12145 / JCM 21818 / CCUG 39354 / LMG 10337 / NBRC 100064 / NCIMB 13643) TaxID=762903 RepID=F0SBK0_PSESL|nr:D-alanine--D-alanine ligase [Pseudopedobacter saltans]ADY51646.1 D-alanine/D-alanine ligase [Pseudopedobacter saltans DSM 12145]